jgi:tRNA pseudouridine55 synthase
MARNSTRLARRGETVERKPVRVCIHEFAAIRPEGQLIKDNLDGTFDFHARVSCSSGTYVRTLAEDFGKRLYVGAHLAELRRTRVGDLRVEQAITLDELKIHFRRRVDRGSACSRRVRRSHGCLPCI